MEESIKNIGEVMDEGIVNQDNLRHSCVLGNLWLAIKDICDVAEDMEDDNAYKAAVKAVSACGDLLGIEQCWFQEKYCDKLWTAARLRRPSSGKKAKADGKTEKKEVML